MKLEQQRRLREVMNRKPLRNSAASERIKGGQCNGILKVNKAFEMQWNGTYHENERKGRDPVNSHPGQLSIFQPKIRKFPRKYFLVWDRKGAKTKR